MEREREGRKKATRKKARRTTRKISEEIDGEGKKEVMTHVFSTHRFEHFF